MRVRLNNSVLGDWRQNGVVYYWCYRYIPRTEITLTPVYGNGIKVKLMNLGYTKSISRFGRGNLGEWAWRKTHINVYSHTHTLTHKLSRTDFHTQIFIYTHTHTHILSHTCSHTDFHAQTFTHTHTHFHKNSFTHTLTHRRPKIDFHTYTFTHALTQIYTHTPDLHTRR